MYLKAEILKDHNIYSGYILTRPCLDQLKFTLVTNVKKDKGDIKELAFFYDENVRHLHISSKVYHHISEFNNWCTECGLSTNVKRWSKQDKLLFYLSWVEEFILLSHDMPIKRYIKSKWEIFSLGLKVLPVNLVIAVVAYLLGYSYYSLGIILGGIIWLAIHFLFIERRTSSKILN